MKKVKFAAIMLACSVLVLNVGCSKSEENEETTVESTVAVVETDAIVETQTTAYPTGIPLNQSAYVEFESPIAYNVISDADAYTDNSVQTYATTYVAGSMVIGVATDGHYVILDNETVVEASNLEAMQ